MSRIFCLTFIAFLFVTPAGEWMSPAIAAPGAHGPNGEHLDAPVATGTGAGASPRIEARSEVFELVGRLQGGELSLFLNRFETNEPVLGAKVELSAGGIVAPAAFHADQGDYAVADAKFLAAVSQPGDHALVITVVAGEEADLLEGTLSVPSHDDDHAHSLTDGLLHGRGAQLLAALVVAGASGLAGWLLVRRLRSRKPLFRRAP